MADRNEVYSLFGVSPEVTQARIDQQRRTALQGMDQYSRAGAKVGDFLSMLAGVEDPRVSQARQLQEAMSTVDVNDPIKLREAAKMITALDPDKARQIFEYADNLEKTQQPVREYKKETRFQTVVIRDKLTNEPLLDKNGKPITELKAISVNVLYIDGVPQPIKDLQGNPMDVKPAPNPDDAVTPNKVWDPQTQSVVEVKADAKTVETEDSYAQQNDTYLKNMMDSRNAEDREIPSVPNIGSQAIDESPSKDDIALRIASLTNDDLGLVDDTKRPLPPSTLTEATRHRQTITMLQQKLKEARKEKAKYQKQKKSRFSNEAGEKITKIRLRLQLLRSQLKEYETSTATGNVSP